MTPEEANKILKEKPEIIEVRVNVKELTEWRDGLIEWAIQQERERCAKRVDLLRGQVFAGTATKEEMDSVLDYLLVAIRGDHPIPERDGIVDPVRKQP